MSDNTNQDTNRRYAFVGWVDHNREPHLYATDNLKEAHQGRMRVDYESTATTEDERRAEIERAMIELRAKWFTWHPDLGAHA